MNQPPTKPDGVPEAEAASSGNISVDIGRTQRDSSTNDEMPRLTRSDHAIDIGRLGKYRIQKELGRGGMGAVFLAFDERLQRKVALKVMLPSAAADRGAKERFLREARAAAQISSDYVVNIFEADEIDGTPYIALQFLQGCPLDDYLAKQGNPSLPQIIKIGQEAALGLEAAHQLGLVHRDIKPANLWLESPQGRVKILDFGLARQQQTDDVNLTRKGTVVGTPAFMSPEQARGLSLDHRSDLFSLGGVLYRLCTGRLPFAGDTTMALLTALAVDEPTPVRQLNPSVPEPLANLIHRLLAKDPTHRPPTAKAVADELNAFFTAWQTQQQMSQLPVVFMPMAIAPQEANPFEGITEFGGQTSSSATQVEMEDESPAAKPFPTMLVASLLFALLVVVGAVVMLTNGGKKTDPDTANKAPTPTKQTEPTKKDDPPKIDHPPKPNPGEAFTLKVGNPAVDMRFHWIPPGTFQMGGDKEPNEKPVHKVTISRGFWMAETETTQAQWKAVMGNNPSDWKGDSLPVEGVMWTQAVEFCGKLTKLSGKPIRLPTEAEWEYACRAGGNTDYHTGNGEENLKRAGWYVRNGASRTQPVGMKEANAWGLHDMHGNVWEFCLDNARPYAATDETDPHGGSVSTNYARRGGSWFDSAPACRAATRFGVENNYQDKNIGFRVCFRPEQ